MAKHRACPAAAPERGSSQQLLLPNTSRLLELERSVTTQVALTAHLRRNSYPAKDLPLLHRAKAALREVGVDHATLQLEPADSELDPI